MEFRDFSLEDSEGIMLAHSVKFGGRVFKKGRVLSSEDLIEFGKAGYTHIIGAKLAADDISEDFAADQIAEAICGENVLRTAPFTGRCNLYANCPGVALIDVEGLHRINLIDESLTIATVNPFDLVSANQMLATIKIIPFAAPRKVIEAGSTLARQRHPLIRLAPLKQKKIGLILTFLPNTKESLLKKSLAVTRQRINQLGSILIAHYRCVHRAEDVANNLKNLLDSDCEVILIFGASANVDRRDVVPSGILRSGGKIDHFGMPVDPGNLMLLAHHGSIPIVGLPGCARSLKENGFDWVLWRILSDVAIRPRDIMTMGVGGLLKEIPVRPQPRNRQNDKTEEVEDGTPRVPRIAAIVLAAGQSRRTGSVNKLLADIKGTPMSKIVLQEVLKAEVHSVFVVTGFEQERVESVLFHEKVTFIANPNFKKGLSTSLIAGLNSLPKHIDGVLICLGDMPKIKTQHINSLIAAFNPLEGRAICVPTFQGKRGNPVLWGTTFFEEIRELAGDIGARQLLDAYGELVAEVPIKDDGILFDVDTPRALKTINS